MEAMSFLVSKSLKFLSLIFDLECLELCLYSTLNAMGYFHVQCNQYAVRCSDSNCSQNTELLLSMKKGKNRVMLIFFPI